MSKHRKKIPPHIRAAVLKRDNYRCRHCKSKEDLTMDHKIPLAKGGTNDIKNLQTLCKTCNNAKGSRTNYIPPTMLQPLRAIKERIKQLERKHNYLK